MKGALVAALVLVFSSDTVAFMPFASRRLSSGARTNKKVGTRTTLALNGIKTPVFPTPLVTSTTPISSDLTKHRDIVEAGRKLVEIEAAAEKARGYLEYLAQVADVIRAYLEDQSAPLRAAIDVRERENTQEAKDYLVNIEKATASALQYLEHLENMAEGIRTYLGMFQERHAAGNANARSVQQANEAQNTLNDLEETAEAAKDYLKYLQTVAGVAQRYLEDSNLKGIQDFMPAEARQLSGLKGIEDFMPRKEGQDFTVGPRPTRVIGTHPKPKVVPPPAPALEVDTTTPRPVKRIAPPIETISKSINTAEKAVGNVAAGHGSYLDSLRSSTTDETPQKTVSRESLNYLDSLASTPSASGIPKSGGANQRYLDSITSSSMGTNSRYLDSINNPPYQRQTGTTPTSHFKESADSTPFSEVGPPERGRSDVSHMDSMDTQMSSPADPSQTAVMPTRMTTGTSSYLTSMGSTATTNSQPPMAGTRGTVAPTSGSYLDQLSQTETPKQTIPSAYSDMDSVSSVLPNSNSPESGAPASGSYLDQLSAPSGASFSRFTTRTVPETKISQTSSQASTSFADNMTSTANSPPPTRSNVPKAQISSAPPQFHSDQKTSPIAIPDSKLRTSTPTKRKSASIAGQFSTQKKKLSQPEPVGWSRAISSKDTMSPGNLFLFMVEQYVLLLKGQLGYAKRVMLNCLNGAIAYGTWEEHVQKELGMTHEAMKQKVAGMQGTAMDIATSLVADAKAQQPKALPQPTRVIGAPGSKPVASLLI